MAESEEEVDVLVQRVVKDITNAFKRNPNIDEIGVIPCPEARYNRSPIVLVENKLGVESWCVKFLLPYVHNKLLLYRQRRHWLDREALVDITSTLLLLNPDFTTAWNVRKELLQCGFLSPEKDLYLGQLALTKFPKSPETWIHRRWVLQQILLQNSAPDRGKSLNGGAGGSLEPSEQLSRTLHQEMKVCADAAGRYPSNYNAWSHRIWVLQHMASGSSKVFHDELTAMRLWVSMHVSDHSGFHYRQFLLKELTAQLCPPQQGCPPLQQGCPPQQQGCPPQQQGCPPLQQGCPPLQQGCPPLQQGCPSTNGEVSGAETRSGEERQLGLSAVFQLFHQEMELCSDLIQSFPGHETLWSHRRHVFYLWHQWRAERHCSSAAAVRDAGPVSGQRRGGEAMEVDRASAADPHDSKRLKRGAAPPGLPTLPSEHGFVSGVLRSCCSPEQRRFAAAYRKWLDTVVQAQS
ncbi:protein prenyltransferase alpha subunit repeat-containing protein 1 [Salarias fasciatus]|uniref:Protein prenyltransferase alpha subunit repeat containing 1 n=1 Tax=Salarias fasciatus TaxID=181472 RepID=A0A672GAY1_SALFA|nr:protein prenyltransferase alpha subunit repeat-containing protein 1 [Salarias fasciatus]